MTAWRIGVFRPLQHVPTEYVINFRGARLVMALCGSFCYVDREPGDLGLEVCPTCVERERKRPRPTGSQPRTDGWPAELKSMLPS